MKNKHKKSIIFYDAVHKKIIISDPLAQELIFTREFQRLKHIRQLGTLFLLLNTSCHTRFSHSIGTYHLVNKLLRKKRFEFLDLKLRLEVEIAALLHDLGHGFFSHVFEKVFPNFQHEEFTVKILQNQKGQIYPILKKYNLNIERIANLISKKTDNDWGKYFISHQFDFDRLDYLMRDPYFLGLKNLNINIDRLFDNIFIADNKLFFHERALLDLENYLLFRFYLHKSFFWNVDNIFFDKLFISIFQRLKDLIKEKHNFSFEMKNFSSLLKNEEEIVINDFLNLDDNSVFELFRKIQQYGKDAILLKLVNVFLNPSHHWPLCQSKEEIQKQKLFLKKQKWPLKYFLYTQKLFLSIYQIDIDEILIKSSKNKIIKKMSDLSLFFNRNHERSEKITLALKLI